MCRHGWQSCATGSATRASWLSPGCGAWAWCYRTRSCWSPRPWFRPQGRGSSASPSDTDLRELLRAIEDPQSRVAATAERSLLAELDGSCRMPIGGYARVLEDGRLLLTGMVARTDGSFLLTRSLAGRPADAD